MTPLNNMNQPWTEKDETLSREMLAAKRSKMLIAAKLKRSVIAVRGRAQVLRSAERKLK